MSGQHTSAQGAVEALALLLRWRTLPLLAPFLYAAAVAAQPDAQRVFKVGLVWNSLPQADLDRRATAHPGPMLIEDGLRDLGWVRGRNVELMSRSAESRYERFPAIVDALVRMPVDVLVVFGPEAAKVARERTATIPIVFAGSYNVPPGTTPHRNVTGMTFMNPVGKRLELLKAIAPRATRVAMFAHVLPGQRKPTISPPLMEAARRIGVEPFAVYIEGAEDLEGAFARARTQRADAIYMSVFPQLTWSPGLQSQTVELAARHKWPAVYETPGMAKVGGLIAFGTDDFDNYRRAPYFIDRILRGAQPGHMPMEEPMKFQLNINRRTARELAIEIPVSLLIQADNVFD